jgi:hypothetical protein
MGVSMPVLLKENGKILSCFPSGEKRLYFDVALSIVFNRPVLDLIKFEDFMHQVYGEYEEEQGLSLYELLVREKGEVFAGYIEGFI